MIGLFNFGKSFLCCLS